MNSENLDLNIPQPDPDWNYYGLWQDVHLAKNNLDKAIKYIGSIENPKYSTDSEIAEKLNDIADLLKNCAFSLKESGLGQILEDEEDE